MDFRAFQGYSNEVLDGHLGSPEVDLVRKRVFWSIFSGVVWMVLGV